LLAGRELALGGLLGHVQPRAEHEAEVVDRREPRGELVLGQAIGVDRALHRLDRRQAPLEQIAPNQTVELLRTLGFPLVRRWEQAPPRGRRTEYWPDRVLRILPATDHRSLRMVAHRP